MRVRTPEEGFGVTGQPASFRSTKHLTTGQARGHTTNGRARNEKTKRTKYSIPLNTIRFNDTNTKSPSNLRKMPPPTLPNLTLTSSTTLFDALIIGAGPAGLSAALALARVRGTAVVFNSDNFRNAKGHRAHYTLSRDHQPASEVRRVGREEIARYGTTRFVDRGVVRAGKNEGEGGGFEVEDAEGETWRGSKVVLATGVKDEMESGIEGYEACWGSTIHQCLFCDGIEMNDMPAGVLGFDNPGMTVHNIGLILRMGCPGVTIFGNGRLDIRDEKAKAELEVAKRMGAKIEEREIARLVQLPEREGMEIQFRDGGSTRVGFLAHKPITRPNARHLAEGLGVAIVSDGMGGEMLQRSEPFGESNVKGVLVAGDAGGMIKAFVHSMAQGTFAGVGVANTLLGEEHHRIASELEA